VIASYDDFISVCRDRADELELSRLEIDHISGLSTGYASILLMKTPRKNFGPISLTLMLDALGLRLLVVEDPKLTAHTLKRRTKRVSSHAHSDHPLPRRVFSGPGAMETIVSNASSWQRIEAAKRGVGPLLLRDGTGPNDPAYVGYQADDGRWMFGDIETKPCYFCQVPPFDSDDGAAV
jgi:hypothetical protein